MLFISESTKVLINCANATSYLAICNLLVCSCRTLFLSASIINHSLRSTTCHCISEFHSVAITVNVDLQLKRGPIIPTSTSRYCCIANNITNLTKCMSTDVSAASNMERFSSHLGLYHSTR